VHQGPRLLDTIATEVRGFPASSELWVSDGLKDGLFLRSDVELISKLQQASGRHVQMTS
jgi:hypothetical protein